MNNKYINWPQLYQQPALFHIYLTERGRGKSDTKGWEFLTIITTTRETNLAWIRRRWHDSLLATKPFFQSLIYSFCEEKNLDSNQFEIRVNQNEFDTKEQGVFYQGLLRIHFYDLFSYQRVRGAIARTSFLEIVFEEAIPIDQEFLPREQHDFRDLVKSLKGRKGKDGQKIPTKITFLANTYSWSAWLLDVFTNLFKLKKEAESKKEKNDNSGVLEIVKDKKEVEWLLYINLIEGEDDPHYSALEEKINPSQRNWDDFMIDEPGKYRILHAIQDFYFCEIGVRKVNKKYCLMHFTKNKKETDNSLVNFCFNLEEKAKSKLKNCVLRKKPDLISKWVNMLKEGMLKFRDFRSRDWFLAQLK
ncbi:MAG: hypothetical protein MRERV_40c017 [Mycoplasmataceae bacterium RV_VA103A]|nr:MAG: hypothetical protein MRERV_40c017 [Mycoplasmataceae bacterium RV_VA103A]